HVPVVFAGLVGAAEDHVVDLRGVEGMAAEDLADDQRGQVVGAHGAERAAQPAHGGANGTDDDGFPGHPPSPPSSSSRSALAAAPKSEGSFSNSAIARRTSS